MGLIILYFLGALSMSFLCSVLEAVLLSTPMSFITMKESQGKDLLIHSAEEMNHLAGFLPQLYKETI